jgi:hypothetical protein
VPFLVYAPVPERKQSELRDILRGTCGVRIYFRGGKKWRTSTRPEGSRRELVGWALGKGEGGVGRGRGCLWGEALPSLRAGGVGRARSGLEPELEFRSFDISRKLNL